MPSTLAPATSPLSQDALSPHRSLGQSPSTMPLLAQAQPSSPETTRSERLSDLSILSGRHGASTSSVNQSPSSLSLATSVRYGPTRMLPETATGYWRNSHSTSISSMSRDDTIGNLSLIKSSAPPAASVAYFVDEDDELHTLTAADGRDVRTPFNINSWRGWINMVTLLVLAAGAVMLFAGYPIITWYYDDRASSGSNTSGFNLGGINGSGQYPSLPDLPVLVDVDTPANVYTRTGFDGNTWNLVFSDEFNKDGRTFYDGDDPFFTAVDLYYWTTGDFEYYDPSAVTTKNGNLQITVSQQPIHDLNFKSGMIQSWNQLCFFKNAYVEVSVSLPGVSTVGGFWPGIWLMGNLGRPGYGATTDGMWPYSYSSCDVGILPNQTWVNGTGPAAALTSGANGASLSYLPGMRASACTCPDEDHPGPSHDIGRAAVEIDIIEAQIVITEGMGQVSQSSQLAPFDDYYEFANTTADAVFYNTDITSFNNYKGGTLQQSVSAVTMIDSDVYYGSSGDFAVYGVEFVADLDDSSSGYITWVSQGEKSWTMNPSAIGPNPRTQIGQRLVSQEPMALVFNLGMSNSFETVDFSHMTFPNYLLIDYIRVYQNEDGILGCDPDERPTAAYIAKYPDIYANPNITSWEQAGYATTKNQMTGC